MTRATPRGDGQRMATSHPRRKSSRAITDVLDKRGYYNQTLPHDIVGLTPETRLAGLAFPASGKPTRSADPEPAIRAFLTLLGAVPREAILVIQAHDDV